MDLGQRGVVGWVGVGLRTVINIFDPEIIVLGGSMTAVWEARRNIVDTTIDRWALMTPRRNVIIRPSAFGLDSPWRGAAELVFAPLLSDPVGVLENSERVLPA